MSQLYIENDCFRFYVLSFASKTFFEGVAWFTGQRQRKFRISLVIENAGDLQFLIEYERILICVYSS